VRLFSKRIGAISKVDSTKSYTDIIMKKGFRGQASTGDIGYRQNIFYKLLFLNGF